MIFRKKSVYISIFIISLLFFAACIYIVEEGASTPEDAKDDLTLIAGFSKEGGNALSGNTVRLFSGERGADYPLDESGKLQITGFPRQGEMSLSVLDPQGRTIGTMTLSISEGAVIDAATSEDGSGYITLRRDTDVIAITFSLLNDGSLQCGLWLT